MKFGFLNLSCHASDEILTKIKSYCHKGKGNFVRPKAAQVLVYTFVRPPNNPLQHWVAQNSLFSLWQKDLI